MFIKNEIIGQILSKYLYKSMFQGLNINGFDISKLDISCTGSFLHYFIEGKFHLMKDIDFYPNNIESLELISNSFDKNIKHIGANVCCNPNSVNVEIGIPFTNLFCEKSFKDLYSFATFEDCTIEVHPQLSVDNYVMNVHNFYKKTKLYNLYINSDECVYEEKKTIPFSDVYKQYPLENLPSNFLEVKKKDIKNVQKRLNLSIITNPKYVLNNITDTVNKFDSTHVLWYYNLSSKEFYIKHEALLSLLSKFLIINDDMNIELGRNIYMYDRIEKHRKRFFVHQYMLYKYLSMCFPNEKIDDIFFQYDNNDSLTIDEAKANFFESLSEELLYSYNSFYEFIKKFKTMEENGFIDNIESFDAYITYKDILEIKKELFKMLFEMYPEYLF